MKNRLPFELVRLIHDTIGPLKSIEGLISLTQYKNSKEEALEIHRGLRECLRNLHKIMDFHGIKLSADDLNKYSKKLCLPASNGFVFVPMQTIMRVQGSGNYCTFYLANGQKYMVSKNLKEYENMLDKKHFFRCHTSHIVNTLYVQKFINKQGCFVEMEDNSIVEVSRRRKDEFLQRME